MCNLWPHLRLIQLGAFSDVLLLASQAQQHQQNSVLMTRGQFGDFTDFIKERTV